jgi:hypothetical protein
VPNGKVPAAVTKKLTLPDVPPPGAGLDTVTVALPTVAMSAAVMVAVSCVLLTNAVARALPFQFTTDDDTKPEPVTVNAKPAPPAVAVPGESEVRAGVGLLVIVKVSAFDVPPPGGGLTTVTEALPTAAMSAAVIAAVSCVALTNVVARALPFQFTTDDDTNPVPVTVSVKSGLPTVVLVGDNDVNTGTGVAALIVNVKLVSDWPPPGVGFTAVTEAVPAVAISLARIETLS